MGLGASWPVLCIINGFAAWRAKTPKESVRICGDDLIALMTRRQRQQYDHTLEALGLKINFEKSFFGPYGTFCERLAVPTITSVTSTKVDIRDVGHIAELCASKFTAGKSSAGLATLDQVSKIDDSIARKTLRRLQPHSAGTGPLRFGGRGDGVVTARRLVDVLNSPSMGVGLSPRIVIPVDIMDGLEIKERGEYPLSQLIIDINTAISQTRHIDAQCWKPVQVEMSDPQKEFRALSKHRGPEPTIREARDAVLHSKLPSKQKKIISFLLRSPNSLQSLVKRRRIQTIISRGKAERFVSREDATKALIKMVPPKSELTRLSKLN